MRGLMEKDIRLTLTRKQTLLIFFVMALILGISMDGSFLIGYLTMLATIISIGTISYDEYDNGLAFLMTLPFERKTYVREKYVFTFLMACGAWCIGALVDCAGCLIRHDPLHLASDLPMLLSILPVMFLSAAIMIPLQLKYGAEKSRTVLFIIFGVIAVIILGSQSVLHGTANPFSSIAAGLDSLPSALIFTAITAVCALLSFISYLWCVRIMEKKEF